MAVLKAALAFPPLYGVTGCRMSQAIQVDHTVPQNKGMNSLFKDSIHCIDAPMHIVVGTTQVSGVVWLKHIGREEFSN